MVYLGSKRKLAKDIGAILIPFIEHWAYRQKQRVVYWEPFCGGGNMIEYINSNLPPGIKDDRRVQLIGTDINYFLMDLLSRRKRGYLPNYEWTYEDKELLQEHKDYINKVFKGEIEDKLDIPKWYFAYIFLCFCYRGMWNSGLALSKNDKGCTNRIISQIRNLNKMNLKDIWFAGADYLSYAKIIIPTINENKYHTLIYCDPPYPSTDQSVYTRSKLYTKFEYDDKFKEFINLVNGSDYITLYLSDVEMPQIGKWECVFEKVIAHEPSHSAGKVYRSEKLFKLIKE